MATLMNDGIIQVELTETYVLERPYLKIWLDDVRNPDHFGRDNHLWLTDSVKFIGVIQYLLNTGEDDDILSISFDNDLGEGSAEGYELFCWVEELLSEGKLKGLKTIYVHSSNPSAVHKFMLASRTFKHHFDVDVIRTTLRRTDV